MIQTLHKGLQPFHDSHGHRNNATIGAGPFQILVF